jgi:flavodoxin
MFALIGVAGAAGPLLSADKRILICWFSRSGNTKRVVDTLQPILRADLFQIKVDADYSGATGLFRSLWHCLRRTRPALTVRPPDFSQYDVVVVASPVWGWDVSPPVASFLAACDFAGRQVVPLGTCQSNMGKYVENVGASLRNGRLVRRAGFAALEKETDQSLTKKVMSWVNDNP